MGASFTHNIACAWTHAAHKTTASRPLAAAPDAQLGFVASAGFCSPGAPLGACIATDAGLNLDDDVASFVVPAPLPSAAIEGLCIDPRNLVGQASTDPFLTAAELAKLFPWTQGLFLSPLSKCSALSLRS